MGRNPLKAFYPKHSGMGRDVKEVIIGMGNDHFTWMYGTGIGVQACKYPERPPSCSANSPRCTAGNLARCFIGLLCVFSCTLYSSLVGGSRTPDPSRDTGGKDDDVYNARHHHDQTRLHFDAPVGTPLRTVTTWHHVVPHSLCH